MTSIVLASCGISTITVAEADLKIGIGQKFALTVNTLGMRNIGEEVYFSSDDTNIVLVDEVGNIYARNAGKAKINIFSSYRYNISTNVEVTVTNQ